LVNGLIFIPYLHHWRICSRGKRFSGMASSHPLIVS